MYQAWIFFYGIATRSLMFSFWFRVIFPPEEHGYDYKEVTAYPLKE